MPAGHRPNPPADRHHRPNGTLRIRDAAVETALAAERDALGRKLQEAREGRDEWRKRCFWAIAAAALILWRAIGKR